MQSGSQLRDRHPDSLPRSRERVAQGPGEGGYLDFQLTETP